MWPDWIYAVNIFSDKSAGEVVSSIRMTFPSRTLPKKTFCWSGSKYLLMRAKTPLRTLATPVINPLPQVRLTSHRDALK
jgi:hypothetical protein